MLLNENQMNFNVQKALEVQAIHSVLFTSTKNGMNHGYQTLKKLIHSLIQICQHLEIDYPLFGLLSPTIILQQLENVSRIESEDTSGRFEWIDGILVK